MAKIITMGEIMLRLSTPGNSRFIQTDCFDAVYGGGEANVAVSCANYGHQASFITRLPAHEIGQAAVNALRRYRLLCSIPLNFSQRMAIMKVIVRTAGSPHNTIS